jgi:hypothetical protein
MSIAPEIVIVVGMLGALFAVPGCAEDIAPQGAPDAGAPTDEEPPPTTVRNADGSYTTRIDASSATAWAWLDLATGALTGADDAWDLAAQRFHLRLGAGAAVAPIAADFAAVTEAPDAGWRTDAPDADGNGRDELAFERDGGWYTYDPATHVLTPRPLVWAVRMEDSHAIKLVVESYYDEAGTSGHLRLRWAPLTDGGTP